MQSSPSAEVLLQTVADPYLALREATGQWTLSPAVVTQSVEAAKAYARRTCDPNANRVSNQSNWDPKNLVMLSAGSSVLNPDMLSAFWEWLTAILAKKGATWATAETFAAADGPLPIGDAIALTLILSDFLLDAESRITIEKNSNEDNKDPSDIISKFFGEQSTPANPPPNGGKNNKKPDDENWQNEPRTGKNGLTYQSNPKHSIGGQGNRRNAGIEPTNSFELFQDSVPDPKNSNVRFSYDSDTGGVHRFFSDGNGTWHWSGSTVDVNNPLSSSQIPVSIRRLFNLPMKGW